MKITCADCGKAVEVSKFHSIHGKGRCRPCLRKLEKKATRVFLNLWPEARYLQGKKV